jgi:AbrB family looped-hinge helix DNA binding protein
MITGGGMVAVKLSDQGQLVIPQDVRDRLGLVGGDVLHLEEKNGGIVLHVERDNRIDPLVARRSVEELVAKFGGMIKGPLTDADIDTRIELEVAKSWQSSEAASRTDSPKKSTPR